MASLADDLARRLLGDQHVAALATENPDGSIHMVAVWYWFDGTHVLVDTSSRSRKARNLQSIPKVSLVGRRPPPRASRGNPQGGAGGVSAGRPAGKEKGGNSPKISKPSCPGG